ncbi:hypothetical protein SKAU_G00337870 [Synaphobranchus kaupii]|uniref:Uncharacterized protein n=1 Tax=Synaphobranchus kaupii TaxID=118154 RepID=A0A9Q1EMI4_SYNKA|nr:hypothetical protein SKAU_G00337870 [Synaphobranchus kaupii]
MNGEVSLNPEIRARARRRNRRRRARERSSRSRNRGHGQTGGGGTGRALERSAASEHRRLARFRRHICRAGHVTRKRWRRGGGSGRAPRPWAEGSSVSPAVASGRRCLTLGADGTPARSQRRRPAAASPDRWTEDPGNLLICISPPLKGPAAPFLSRPKAGQKRREVRSPGGAAATSDQSCDCVCVKRTRAVISARSSHHTHRAGRRVQARARARHADFNVNGNSATSTRRPPPQEVPVPGSL